MSFLPVVERELRINARSSRFYWLRFGTALVAIAIIAWLWLVSYGGRASSAQMAALAFEVLAWLAFVFCIVLGLFLTADCISEEKREGTLGLLFLTNLKGYDVAFGKLASNSFRAIYSLVAIFPVLTIPLLLGGLVGQEIFRVALTLLVTLIFSLSLGLFISAFSRHDRKAQFGALFVMIGLTTLWPVILAVLENEHHWPISDLLYGISPGTAFMLAFQKRFPGNEVTFWASLGMVHALSWIAFIAAATIVRRVWQDRPEGVAAIGWRAKLRAWKRGLPEVRRRYRESLLGINPYYWLAARDRWKPWYVAWFLGAGALFWIVMHFYFDEDMIDPDTFFAWALIFHTVMKIWIATEAGRQIAEDRRSSALELTLSTPLPVRDILEGQFFALLRQFGIPMAAILVFDVIGMVLGARGRLSSDSDVILMWLAVMIVFIVDAVTIATFGMWLGLVARRSSRAIVQNLFYVLCVPWLIFIGLLTYMMLVRYSGIDSMAFFIGAYFVVSIATDFVLFLRASGNLTSRFREAATQRYDAGK